MMNDVFSPGPFSVSSSAPTTRVLSLSLASALAAREGRPEPVPSGDPLDERAQEALGLLFTFGSEPLTAVGLARALSLNVPEAQQCLVDLEHAGLIARPSDSTDPIFHLEPAGVAALVQLTLPTALNARRVTPLELAPAQPDVPWLDWPALNPESKRAWRGAPEPLPHRQPAPAGFAQSA